MGFNLTELEYQEIKRICFKELLAHDKDVTNHFKIHFTTLSQIVAKIYGKTHVVLCTVRNFPRKTKTKQFKKCVLKLEPGGKIVLYRK